MITNTTTSQVSSKTYPINYIIGLIVGILVLIPTLLIAQRHQLTGLQARLFYDINNLSDVFKIPALVITEGLGSVIPIVLCVLIAAAFKRYRLAWLYFVTAGGTTVIMYMFKIFVKQPRPTALLDGHVHARAIEMGLNSFPSGHAAVATALALTTWLILPKKWRWLAILWIVAVAFSRVYLGVHTVNDVLGGVAVGLISVSVLRLLPPAIAKPLRLGKDKPLLERDSQPPARKHAPKSVQ